MSCCDPLFHCIIVVSIIVVSIVVVVGVGIIVALDEFEILASPSDPHLLVCGITHDENFVVSLRVPKSYIHYNVQPTLP